ncbi:class I SAM-dependent methyltransferase [Candidatus Berkelbacteria bacterium]|nr:class I SAM-dependent methyltransferase [Candidatus Berkelbacteria bacterium]
MARSRSLKDRVLGQYRTQSFLTRLFLWLRWRLTFFERLLACVPRQGLVVDIGCGHGLWPVALVLDAPAREVVGYDPDRRRIEQAERVAAQVPRVRFTSHWEDLASLGPTSVTVVDVLILLPPRDKERLLGWASDHLVPGGTLLLKVNGTEPRLKHWFSLMEERFMTSVGPTHATSGLHSWPVAEYVTLCQALGFEITRVERLDRWYHPQPHSLIVAEKPATPARVRRRS